MKKILFTAIVFTGAAVSANAQALATANASATIVSPISIVKNTDMDFGNVAVSSIAGGTVTLDPSASGTRSTSGGGVTLPAITGTVSAASFTVTGQANFSFDVTLPFNPITLENGANAMTAENFTLDAAAGTLDAGGTQDIYVGADLLVAAGQAPGVYTTSSAFLVTVNYN